MTERLISYKTALSVQETATFSQTDWTRMKYDLRKIDIGFVSRKGRGQNVKEVIYKIFFKLIYAIFITHGRNVFITL